MLSNQIERRYPGNLYGVEVRVLKQDESEIATALVETVARVASRGWCDGTSGNYSVTLSRKPLRLLITPSGADKGSVRPGDLLEVDGDGRTASGRGRPSAETELHLILAEQAGAVAVLHTHSIWGTLLGDHFETHGGFTIQGYEMLKGIAPVTSHEESVFVPVVANSQDMSEIGAVLRRWIGDHPNMRGFLIAGHGLYTWGENLAQAYRHVEIFEFLFRLVGRRVRLEPFEG